MKSGDDETIVAYIPEKTEVILFNPKGIKYTAKWFNPVTNEYSDAKIVQDSTFTVDKHDYATGELSRLTIQQDLKTIKFTHNFENDMLILLKK